MKPIVIYHANCQDGFAAAFAAWTVLGDDAEYVPMQYGKDDIFKIPPWTARDVYILDFSLPRDYMDKIFSEAKRVVWLDHHASVFKDYGLDPDKRFEEIADRNLPEYGFLPYHKSHVTILDNANSGAVLAWEYFHPNKDVPQFIRHVDDYDRWVFALTGTKEFNKALWSYAPWSFQLWKHWFGGSPKKSESMVFALRSEGTAILRAHNQNVQAVVKGAARKCMIQARLAGMTLIADFHGLAANCPPHLTSDVGHELANQSGTFGLLWYVNKDGKCLCSLRSNGDYDVSAIAKAFGGGGHATASGFEVDIQTLLGWIK